MQNTVFAESILPFGRFAVASILVVAFAGCSQRGSGLEGTYITSIAESDAPQNASTDLRENAVGRWRIHLVGGKLRVTRGGELAAEGTYQVTGTQVTFNDAKGPAACQGQAGTYTWERSGSELSFSDASDPCEGRKMVLTSRPLAVRP